jgi:hypothetical protein
VHRQQDGEAPRVSVDLNDPENIHDKWNSDTPEVSGGSALGGDRLRQEGTPERVEQISWEQAEMDGTLQEQDQISEHQSQYDGNSLRRYDTRSAENNTMLHRMDVEDVSTREIYTMDSMLAIGGIGRHLAISKPISPNTGTQPIQDRLKLIDDRLPPSNIAMETDDEASRSPSIEPVLAAVASPETSENPLQVSVVVPDSARHTELIPTETTKPLSTFEPVISPSIPDSNSPLGMKEAVRGDTKPPLDVLVVDDDK